MTFVVRNAGKLEHEFVVLKTSIAAGQLAKAGTKDAPEKGAVGEIEEIAPGQTKKLALRLKQGHYALICNSWGTGRMASSSITTFTETRCERSI